MMDRLSLAGDRQADLTVHGGEEKAVRLTNLPDQRDSLRRPEQAQTS